MEAASVTGGCHQDSLSVRENGKNSALIFLKFLEKGWAALMKWALALLPLTLVTSFIYLVTGESKREELQLHLVVLMSPIMRGEILPCQPRKANLYPLSNPSLKLASTCAHKSLPSVFG